MLMRRGGDARKSAYDSIRPQIIQVLPGQPAEKAGFRPGDEIRVVDGLPVADSQAFVDAIAARPGQPMVV